jgi:23S rRNA (uridine2552-2'-O)-methyltransferase
VGVDLQATDTAFPDNVAYYQDDVFSPSDGLKCVLEGFRPFDLVISDMAPKTSGIKFADQARSLELAEEALALAKLYLVKGGHFVVKIFQGPDNKAYMDAMRPLFGSVKTFKPDSSRPESKEQFILGISLR